MKYYLFERSSCCSSSSKKGEVEHCETQDGCFTAQHPKFLVLFIISHLHKQISSNLLFHTFYQHCYSSVEYE